MEQTFLPPLILDNCKWIVYPFQQRNMSHPNIVGYSQVYT